MRWPRPRRTMTSRPAAWRKPQRFLRRTRKAPRMLERPVKPRTLCLRRTNKKSGRMNMRQYTIHLLFNINLQHNHHQQSYRGTTVNTCKIVTKLRDLSSNPIQIHVVSERSDAWVILCTHSNRSMKGRGGSAFSCYKVRNVCVGLRTISERKATRL